MNSNKIFSQLRNSFSLIFFVLSLITKISTIKSEEITNSHYYLGIDFGSEYIKASIFNQKSGLSEMVENLQTKTLSNNLFGLIDDERYFGSEANSKQLKYSQKCYAYITDFLSFSKFKNVDEMKQFTSNDKNDVSFFETLMETDNVKHSITNVFNKRYSYNVLDEDIIFEINYNFKKYELSLEGLIAMQLRFFKRLTEKQISFDLSIPYSMSEINENKKELFKGTTIVIPENFDYFQRRILINAANLAELNLLGFVTANDASAYVYAQEYYKFNYQTLKGNENLEDRLNNAEQDKDQESWLSKKKAEVVSEDVVGFINIGSTYCQIGFYYLKVKNNSRKQKEISVLPLNSNIINFGGRQLDYYLLKYFEKNLLTEDKENTSLKASKNESIYNIKMNSQIIKMKEILSANRQFSYNFFGTTGIFVRNTYEQIFGEEITKFTEFLNKNKKELEAWLSLLNKGEYKYPFGNQKQEEKEFDEGEKNIILNSVELLGGSTRVPVINKIINQIFDAENKESDTENNSENKFNTVVGTRINGDDSPSRGASFISYFYNMAKITQKNKIPSKIGFNPSIVKNFKYKVNIYSLGAEEPNGEKTLAEIRSEIKLLNTNSEQLNILKSDNNILKDHSLFEKFHDIGNVETIKLSSVSNNLLVLISEDNDFNGSNSSTVIKFLTLHNIENGVKQIKEKKINCMNSSVNLIFEINFLGEVNLKSNNYACTYKQYFNYAVDNLDEKLKNNLLLHDDKDRYKHDNDYVIEDLLYSVNDIKYIEKIYETLKNVKNDNRISFDFKNTEASNLKDYEIDNVMNNLYPDLDKLNFYKQKLALKNSTYGEELVLEDEKRSNKDWNVTKIEIQKKKREEKLLTIRESYWNKTNKYLNEINHFKEVIGDFVSGVTQNLTFKTNTTVFDSDMKTLKDIDYVDSTREQKLAMRNDLETLIYDVKLKIQENVFDKYFEKDQISELEKVLQEYYDWFDDNGFSATYDTLKEKHETLNEYISPFMFKLSGNNKKINFLEELEVKIKQVKEKSIQIKNEKPWTLYYINGELKNLIEENEIYLKKEYEIIDNDKANNLSASAKIASEMDNSRITQFDDLMIKYSSINEPGKPHRESNLKYSDYVSSKITHPDDLNLSKLIEYEE